MKIAVDFDGTCVEHSFPNVGMSVPNAVEVLKELHEAGHKIFLFTMRSGEYLEDAVSWFVKNNIPLSGIQSDPAQSKFTTSPKCYANIYIDDAAFGAPLIVPYGFSTPVIDWIEVRKQLIYAKSSVERSMEKTSVTLDEVEY